MKAKLFDGTYITFDGSEVKEISIEFFDYSILISFKKNNKGGWGVERAEWISI